MTPRFRRSLTVAALITVVFVALAAAQLFAGSRTFRASPAELADPPGWGPLPVTLYDSTGLVVEVRIWIRPEDGGTESPLLGVELLPDGWVRFGWLGGACVDGTTLVIAEGGPGYRVIWREDGLVLWGCPAIGIHRAVDVRFTRPIEPDRVEVVRG